MKDRFSAVARSYSRFRPHYPDEFFYFLLSRVTKKQRAWDCGTGNGQVATRLSAHFSEVYGTDISAAQMKEAPVRENVHYQVEDSAASSFRENFFDLITVAQAIHWFDFDRFYAEVRRVLKREGVLAVIGYGIIEVNKEVDEIVNRLYTELTGEYWDAERRYIDEGYRTIPFPFKEEAVPRFWIREVWDCARLEGFLGTWSGVRKYNEATGRDAVGEIAGELRKVWGDGSKEVRFPVLLRLGSVR